MVKTESLDLHRLELIWRRVQKPGRYTGGELNQVKKDPDSVKVKVALAFPEVYEIGMSYLGQKILYSRLNRRPEVLAERVYAPWPDFEVELRKSGLPLYSLENHIPVFEFDWLGFSLLYELNHTNLLTILDLGKVPLLSADRNLKHPLVLAGGPAALNPEPLAEFIDLFVFGDGEEVIEEILDRYLEIKDGVRNREELLRGFSDISGVYLPFFYRACSHPKSFLLIPRPEPGFSEKIEKRVVFPLEKASPPDRFVVPNVQSVFDRFQVEVARGCPQNCRFCQASSIYFPYRPRPISQTVEAARKGLEQTGFDDLSFSALSVGDYPFLEQAIEHLMPYLEKQKISVSLPSLRPGRLSRKMVEEIVKIRKTGFTLVPEAGSERLRRVINKKITDEELMTAARYAYEHGWRLLKLYFMIGLPTETAEDLKAIIRLIGELVELGKKVSGYYPSINLSVSPFIPKPHTPFQWLAMEEETLLREKQEYLRSNLKRWKKVELKEHRIKASILEAVFSRGDRRLGAVLRQAYHLGARFDGWLDLFNFELWEKAFEKEGLDYHLYLQAIDQEAALPWEVVEVGLKKSYLLEELKAAREARFTDSCEERICSCCQACFWPEYKNQPVAENVPGLAFQGIQPIPPETNQGPIRYRASFEKIGLSRFISHNDLLNHLERAIRRSGFRLAFSRGFHPKLLASYGPALPLGLAARAEVMEFKALEEIQVSRFLEAVNSSLPEGLRFLGLKACSPDCLPIFQDIAFLVYSLDLMDSEAGGIENLEEKLNPDRLNEILESYQNKIKVEPELASHRIKFLVEFETQRPIRIQDVIGKLLGLENSVYLLTRDYIIFKDGSDSRGLCFLTDRRNKISWPD